MARDRIAHGFTTPTGALGDLAFYDRDRTFVAALGRPALNAALSPGATLGSTAAFRTASRQLGAWAPPTFFLDPAPLVALAEATPSLASTLHGVAPYLRRLGPIVAATRGRTSRLLVTVR